MHAKKETGSWMAYTIGIIAIVIVCYTIIAYRHNQRVKQDQGALEAVLFEEELRSQGFQKVDVDEAKRLKEWQYREATE